MKLGIVTIYDLLNYGNRLQNYATTVVMNKLGVQADTLVLKELNFKDLVKIVLGRKNVGNNWNWKQETMEYYETLNATEKTRFANFKKFTYDFISVKKEIYLSIIPHRLNSEYDFFITGSDQVWNPYVSQANNWEFLTFASKRKRVSFSASFGVDKLNPSDEKKMA